MDVAVRLARDRSDRVAQLFQHRQSARLMDRVDGVEAQAVETIVLDPVQGVFDRERLHFRHGVVDRRTPGRRRAGEESGA